MSDLPEDETAAAALSDASPIDVEVIHALPRQVWRVALRLPVGSTVADALEQSNMEKSVPGLIIDPKRVGVFYRPCSMTHELRDGDRVEIYRPLECDPKEVRRRRAAESS